LRSILPLLRDWKALPLLDALGVWLKDRLTDLGWLKDFGWLKFPNMLITICGCMHFR
jgi:hypothetical protein